MLRENDKSLGDVYSEELPDDAIYKLVETVMHLLPLETPKGHKLPDEEILDFVKKSYEAFKSLFQAESDFKEHDECKWGEFYLEFLDETFTEDVIRTQEKMHGEGCMDFVFEAIKKYFKHLGMEIITEEDPTE